MHPHSPAAPAIPAVPAPAGAPELTDAPQLAPPAAQWLSTTTGRLSRDGHSWMQAVHWALETRLHPRLGATTLRLALLLRDLTPCRPGVAYLMRRLALGERMVQYHLAALRECGLLAYLVKGGRIRGLGCRASEFARCIPLAFDRALGLRTLGSGPHRRLVGIAEHGRRRIAALSRKAARTRRRGRPAGRRHCTPMRVGTSHTISADRTTHPSEGNRVTTAEGSTAHPEAGHRPNTVRRRFALAAELVRIVPWLHRAPVARVAWLARSAADAGWSADEVRAWLNLRDAPRDIRRPAALLAYRLRGATEIWATPRQRAAALEADRDSARSAAARHRTYDYHGGPGDEGPSPAVRALLAEGIRQGLAALRAREQEYAARVVPGHRDRPRRRPVLREPEAVFAAAAPVAAQVPPIEVYRRLAAGRRPGPRRG